MKPKYVFTLCYWQPIGKTKRKSQITESVVAESWTDALTYWRTEFIDAVVDVEWVKRGEPVLTCDVKAARPEAFHPELSK